MGMPHAHERRFVDSLKALAEREDRAALAALRRGMGKPPGGAPEMFPYVVPWVPPNASPWQEEPYYLVAALFALHPMDWPAAEEDHRPTNLGRSFARLANASDSASVERRFVALLNCHRDDLPEHLRHAVSLLASHDVPINWARLLRDIHGWDWEDHPVQRAWARAFWGTASGEEAEKSGTPHTASP